MAAREHSFPRRRQRAQPAGETSSHRVLLETHAAQARKIFGLLRVGEGEREERARDDGIIGEGEEDGD